MTGLPNEFLSFRLGGEEYGIGILRGVIVPFAKVPLRCDAQRMAAP